MIEKWRLVRVRSVQHSTLNFFTTWVFAVHCTLLYFSVWTHLWPQMASISAEVCDLRHNTGVLVQPRYLFADNGPKLCSFTVRSATGGSKYTESWLSISSYLHMNADKQLKYPNINHCQVIADGFRDSASFALNMDCLPGICKKLT